MAFLIPEQSAGVFEPQCSGWTVAGVEPPAESERNETRRGSRGIAQSGGMEPVWLWFVVLLVALVIAEAGAPFPSESDVKAVYLFRFAEYVDWPPESFAGPESPIIIGVLGDRIISQALEATVQDEQVRNRRFVVRTLSRVEEARNCHIVFIGRAEAGSVGELLTRSRSTPVLTVSDLERFADRGGIIRFVNEGGKVRLRINLDAARTARLTVSSKLLRVADVVKETKGE